jgi:hypothetical protein
MTVKKSKIRGSADFTKQTHPHNMATAFAHVKDGVSVLMDAFKQFANKNIIEYAADGFPGAFLCSVNPQAAQSSINDDVSKSKSEPGRNYMQATYKLGPVSFPSSYGEYPDVRIAVFLNYAPDDELDKKGNPTLHFQLMYLANSTISL